MEKHDCKHEWEHLYLGYTTKQYFIDGKIQNVPGRYEVKTCKKCGLTRHFDNVNNGDYFEQEHRIPDPEHKSPYYICPYKDCPFCDDNKIINQEKDYHACTHPIPWCSHCGGKKPKINIKEHNKCIANNLWCEIGVIENKANLLVFYEMYENENYVEIPINYCPFCGDRLN